MKPARVNKKEYKDVEGKCRICKLAIREILDIHRICPGSESGQYRIDNVACLCSNCHRRVHSKEIIIDRWYFSTGGRKLRIIVDGEEQFV